MIKKRDLILSEIRDLVMGFGEKLLDEQHTNFCLKLLDEVNSVTDISRGERKNWAAGIVYAIARVNLLIDPFCSLPLNAGIICDYFGTNKNTASSKASSIRDICYLELGDPDYCNSEVVDAFTFVESAEGIIIPKSFFNKISAVEKMSAEDLEIIKNIEENERLKQKEEREQREKKQLLERIRKKKEKEQMAGQIFLFEEE